MVWTEISWRDKMPLVLERGTMAAMTYNTMLNDGEVPFMEEFYPNEMVFQ